MIFSLESVFTQKLPIKGQIRLAAVLSETEEVSEALKPKNSEIYPATISYMFLQCYTGIGQSPLLTMEELRFQLEQIDRQGYH